MTTREANHYAVLGSGVQATIDTWTVGGEPSATITIDGTPLSGPKISRSEHGLEVSGAAEQVPDSHSIYVRLFVPTVNVDAEAMPFAGLVLLTTALTPFAEELVEGAVHQYQVRPLSGVADAIQV
jgi:hypothetical protein